MKRLLAMTLALLLAVTAKGQDNLPFNKEYVTDFHEPWARYTDGTTLWSPGYAGCRLRRAGRLW
jgi:hypothetical protein